MEKNPWRVVVETAVVSSRIPHRLALEVDPRQRIVRVASRVEGSGDLQIQSGAVARSFFEMETGNLAAAGAFLASLEAQVLLEAIEDGYTCEILWTGDPVARWSDAAWEAGHALYQGTVVALLAPG